MRTHVSYVTSVESEPSRLQQRFVSSALQYSRELFLIVRIGTKQVRSELVHLALGLPRVVDEMVLLDSD